MVYSYIFLKIIDAGHFWAQLSNTEVLSMDEKSHLIPLRQPEEQHIGSYCLAKFSIDKKYYRAKIENIAEGSADVCKHRE